MSKYTTQLCYYLASLAGEETINNYETIINNSWSSVFDFDFPIFSDEYKQVLAKKILMHYYTREIGLETVGLWKLKLQAKMNEIMPYYNRLYSALEQEFNLLYNIDKHIDRDTSNTAENTRESSGTSKSTNTQTGTNKTERSDKTTNEQTGKTTNTHTAENTNKFSDTPSGGLDGVISADYLTTVTIDDGNTSDTTNISDETTVTGTGTDSTTINQTATINGENTSNDKYNGKNTGNEAVHEYGSNDVLSNFERYSTELYNIDIRVINDLSDLFMKLY